MIRLITFFILLVIAGFSSSVYADNWYASYNAALAACQSGWPSGCAYSSTGFSNICAGSQRFYTARHSVDNFYYIGCESGFSTCPNPEETRDINGVCQSPSIVQDCPKNQYKNSSNSCVSIPDCNSGLDHINQSKFFDVTLPTPACVDAGIYPICVASGSSSNTVGCEPLDDCIKPGEVCSNNPADIAANEALKSTVTPAKQTEAAASAQTADNATNDAQAASSAAAAANTAAQQNNTTAQNQAQTGTPEALTAAAQAAAQAATAAQKAANASAQAAQAALQAAIAAAERDKIVNNYPPGQAENVAAAAADAAAKAVKAALDAIQGKGLDGTSGTKDTGTCPDCATEETLKSLMQGEGKQLRTTEKGVFNNSVPDDAVQAAKDEYQTQVNTIKQQLKSMFNIELSGSASLPTIDFGVIKGAHVVVDLNNYAQQLSYVGLMVLFLAVVVAARVILE